MALYIPHSIFHLGRLLYVRPENFGPYYVHTYYFSTATIVAQTRLNVTLYVHCLVLFLLL